MAYLLETEFSGPDLMVFTFVMSFMVGIVCVKSCCATNYGLRSFAHEVRQARRKVLASTNSSNSDGWSGGGSDSNHTMDYSDNRSESGTSTYSASDGVFFDDNHQIVEVVNTEYNLNEINQN